VYSAAKGALVSLSRTIAREYGPKGIRSNCILPGFLETEMSQAVAEQDRIRITQRTALKRLGQAADVTGAISFLLSEEARYITGTELIVDGGTLA
jgi:3-oxoacyl-[acyl-carrier protein] reductase